MRERYSFDQYLATAFTSPRADWRGMRWRTGTLNPLTSFRILVIPGCGIFRASPRNTRRLDGDCKRGGSSPGIGVGSIFAYSVQPRTSSFKPVCEQLRCMAKTREDPGAWVKKSVHGIGLMVAPKQEDANLRSGWVLSSCHASLSNSATFKCPVRSTMAPKLNSEYKKMLSQRVPSVPSRSPLA